jgi:hypothetical protein
MPIKYDWRTSTLFSCLASSACIKIEYVYTSLPKRKLHIVGHAVYKERRKRLQAKREKPLREWGRFLTYKG